MVNENEIIWFGTEIEPPEHYEWNLQDETEVLPEFKEIEC